MIENEEYFSIQLEDINNSVHLIDPSLISLRSLVNAILLQAVKDSLYDISNLNLTNFRHREQYNESLSAIKFFDYSNVYFNIYCSLVNRCPKTIIRGLHKKEIFLKNKKILNKSIYI